VEAVFRAPAQLLDLEQSIQVAVEPQVEVQALRKTVVVVVLAS